MYFREPGGVLFEVATGGPGFAVDEERTETEVANAMGTNQSTINRRKQAILSGLRMKLRNHDEFQRFSA